MQLLGRRTSQTNPPMAGRGTATVWDYVSGTTYVVVEVDIMRTSAAAVPRVRNISTFFGERELSQRDMVVVVGIPSSGTPQREEDVALDEPLPILLLP